VNPQGFANLVTEPAPARFKVTPFAWRLAFVYAALFLVVGCYLPYMPVWLHWRGLDESAIALLLGTPLFARILFTPAIAFAADWTGARRAVLIALAWDSLGSFLLLWIATGFRQTLLAMLLLAVNWTTIMPLIETVAVSGVRRAGIDYGRVRLWGSGSFMLASFGCGLLIGAFGAGAVLPLLLGATALMVLAVHLLPRELAGRNPAVPARSRIRVADAGALMRSRKFLLFLLAASTIQASHALYYTFGTLNWRAQGFAPGTIGALWALGVVAEIGLFAASAPILAAWGAARLLLAAAAAAVLRWALMAGDPTLFGTAMLQCLHAMSFGAAHLAAIYFLTHAVPEDRAATAQGIYAATVAGLGLGLITIACGPLYQLLAGQAYAVMALLAMVGAVSTRLLMGQWRGELVVGPLGQWRGELVVGPLEAQPHNSGLGGETSPA
jgi:MFS transporter, PPP family, 3-phenylpropionic acid transporter